MIVSRSRLRSFSFLSTTGWSTKKNEFWRCNSSVCRRLFSVGPSFCLFVFLFVFGRGNSFSFGGSAQWTPFLDAAARFRPSFSFVFCQRWCTFFYADLIRLVRWGRRSLVLPTISNKNRWRCVLWLFSFLRSGTRRRIARAGSTTTKRTATSRCGRCPPSPCRPSFDTSKSHRSVPLFFCFFYFIFGGAFWCCIGLYWVLFGFTDFYWVYLGFY